MQDCDQGDQERRARMQTKARQRIMSSVGAGSKGEGGSRRENSDGFIHGRWDPCLLALGLFKQRRARAATLA